MYPSQGNGGFLTAYPHLQYPETSISQPPPPPPLAPSSYNAPLPPQEPPLSAEDKATKLMEDNEPAYKDIQDLRRNFVDTHIRALFPPPDIFIEDIRGYGEKLDINLYPVRLEHLSHPDLQSELQTCYKYELRSCKNRDVHAGHLVLHYRNPSESSNAMVKLHRSLGLELRVSLKLSTDDYHEIRANVKACEDATPNIEDPALLAPRVLYVSPLPQGTDTTDIKTVFPTATDIMIFAGNAKNAGFCYAIFPTLMAAHNVYIDSLHHDCKVRIKDQIAKVVINDSVPENATLSDVLDSETRHMFYETIRKGRDLAFSKQGQDNPIYIKKMLEKLSRIMCADYSKLQRDECAREAIGLPFLQPYLSQLIPDITKERWRFFDDLGRALIQPLSLGAPAPTLTRTVGRGRGNPRPTPYNRPPIPGYTDEDLRFPPPPPQGIPPPPAAEEWYPY